MAKITIAAISLVLAFSTQVLAQPSGTHYLCKGLYAYPGPNGTWEIRNGGRVLGRDAGHISVKKLNKIYCTRGMHIRVFN